MRVEQQIDLPRRARLETVEEHLRRISELAVDDEHRIRRHEPPHRPAAGREGADVAPDGREDRDGGRLSRRGRCLLAE